MRILLTVGAALLVTALAGSLALAGDGYDCPNACPLAKSANELRTNGSEGVATSDVVRETVRREILDALDRV